MVSRAVVTAGQGTDEVSTVGWDGSMEVHGILVWIVIGALAGWLSGKIVKGSGFGFLMDLVVGIAGAFLGGWLAGAVGLHIGDGFVASVITATLGAIVLLFALRLFKR